MVVVEGYSKLYWYFEEILLSISRKLLAVHHFWRKRTVAYMEESFIPLSFPVCSFGY